MHIVNALSNENELLVQLIAGDREAFNRIYEHYHPCISAFALRFTKSRTMADDIVQEVFIKIWEHRHQIEQGHHFESYVKTIARNHILNMLKKAARDKVLQQKLYERMQALRSMPPDQLLEKELELLHQQAIFSLPPRQKTTYLLRKQEGLSYKQIAALQQVSKSTVKNQVGEATRNILRQLSGIIGILCLFVSMLPLKK